METPFVIEPIKYILLAFGIQRKAGEYYGLEKVSYTNWSYQVARWRIEVIINYDYIFVGPLDLKSSYSKTIHQRHHHKATRHLEA